MKGDFTLKMLEIIENGASSIGDIILIFGAPYGSSMRGIERYVEKHHSENNRLADEIKSKQRVYDLMFKLKRDGLVEMKNKKPSITIKGKELLKKLVTRKRNQLPTTEYAKNIDTALKVVIFDIPEKDRRKRGWLRQALTNLDFKMLQKSVWIGKIKLPEEFLKNLIRLRLTNFVQIFSINKTGSLKQLDFG